MSWTNDIVLEFLELYRREQHLWNPKHPLHRNRSEVAEAWYRIQTTLSIRCSVTDLKKKKESLMTSFRMHLTKKKSQDGYHTTWFAYPLMESFLGGKYECDSTNQLENEFCQNSSNYNSQAGISLEHTGIDKTIPMSKQKVMAPKSEKNLKNIYNRKRFDETASALQSYERHESGMDEYDLYGQLLATKLRKLDEHQRDLAMHEIDNVMFRAKIQSTSTQTRSYSKSPPPEPRKIKSPGFIHNLATSIQFDDENIPYQQQPPS